jgi:FAD/FMN-containing dehydrogenase
MMLINRKLPTTCWITSATCFLRRRKCDFLPAVVQKSWFESFLGSDRVIDATGSDNAEKYVLDWTHSYRGGSLVCFPRSTEEVSAIVKHCHDHRIGVVAQGGNTGLVGGAVGTARGELILSLSKMNAILDIDTQACTATVEAGVVLEVLDDQAQRHGLVVPLDLGAKGSCMIGGNVATNAGGLRVIKYGSMHSNVLGLEAVLADGTVVDGLRALAKDNTGYHWKHLLIGSEGSLAIITKICMKLVVKPKVSSVILAKVSLWMLGQTVD